MDVSSTDISVIIVSFNTKELLAMCLSSVYGSQATSLEVIVVDNASADDSVNMVAKNFPKALVLKNTKNLGFAKANNQGIEKAQGRYLLLLNSDTTVEPHTLSTLVSYMNTRKEVGILGCQIVSPEGKIQPSAGFYPSLMRVLLWMTFLDDVGLQYLVRPYHVQYQAFFRKEQEVDWVQGACMLIRREVIERIGPLDEDIFMYGEDVEYCARAKNAGLCVHFTPCARIVHVGQGSSKRLPTTALVGEFTGLRTLYTKRHGSVDRFLLSLLLQWGALVRLVLFGFFGGSTVAREAYAKAFAIAKSDICVDRQ